MTATSSPAEPPEPTLAAVLRYCVQDNAKAGPTCSGCAGCPVVGSPGDCVFCSIATGATRADIVDESETWTSFSPLGPHVPGHLLFIPRRHVSDATVEPALTGTVFAAASAYLGRVLKSEGNILTSVGAGATQTVKHLHVHVIPRGPEDGLNHDWPWLRDDQETLDTVREQRDDVLELLDVEREQHRETLAAILAATPTAAHVAELTAALAAAEARLRAVDALAVTWETSGPYYPGAFYAEASAYASGRDDQKEVCADDLRDTLAAALTTPPQPAP